MSNHMKTKINIFGLYAIVFVSVLFFQSCEKDPSIMKIFVRSASNELVEGAKVIIVGDVNSNPVTLPYVDTVVTNGSGFASFNMDSYYDNAGSEHTVSYYDIIAIMEPKVATGYIRSRVNTTAVETVYLPN